MQHSSRLIHCSEAVQRLLHSQTAYLQQALTGLRIVQYPREIDNTPGVYVLLTTSLTLSEMSNLSDVSLGGCPDGPLSQLERQICASTEPTSSFNLEPLELIHFEFIAERL